jgi:tRNA (guanine37-N1)-methyltransferase
MLTFDVITLFPELFETHLEYLPFSRAIENKLLGVNMHNLRDFAVDKRGTVDDAPYGGGVGMVLMVEPIFDALSAIHGSVTPPASNNSKVVILSPRGKTYSQQIAQNYSKLKQITLVCGRYEGIDERATELNKINPNFPEIETVSIGDFVVSGGETPALTIMESVTRLIPGVLEKPQATEAESFTKEGAVEHPQYTRPENFKNLEVPKTLLSGNHKEIDKWREKQSTK